MIRRNLRRPQRPARRVVRAGRAARPTSDKIDVNQLAELFKLPEWDKIDEHNLDYYWESGNEAYKYAIRNEESEEDAEKAREDAESEASGEVFNSWHDGVTSAAERLFGEHDLELSPTTSDRTPFEYLVVPKTTWRAALAKIIETINGVGYFHFNDVEEFLDSGPYTEEEGVLSHLHWIESYPEVYGDTSARSTFDRAFR
jgi:hypothetical protein